MSNRQYTEGKNAKVIYRLFNEIYRTGQPVKAHDLELTKKDGTKSYNELSASLIRNAEGRPIGFRGIARDVTERKQMEEALRQSEERYMLMQNPERVIGMLTAIKNLGVRLALDDFGTGYSSLTQIRRYPIDTIKVDRSFIQNIPEHVEDTAITKTIIAERVETPEQDAFLREQA